jgi:hypothetical protein
LPITLRKANDFVAEHHRHSGRTARNGGKFAIGAMFEGNLIGIAIVGNPLSATSTQYLLLSLRAVLAHLATDGR